MSLVSFIITVSIAYLQKKETRTGESVNKKMRRVLDLIGFCIRFMGKKMRQESKLLVKQHMA